jgi:galactose mutarotase-like enzyme
VSYRQITVSGFPAVALRSEEIEVVAVPAAGMRLTHLRRLRGREWLWRNEQMPLALPKAGASYVETADSGGWDECFPTVEPSPMPGAPPGTAPLPDHGELWSADWVSSLYEDADGTTLRGIAPGTGLPYEFQRDVTLLRGEPVVRLRYRLRHTGDAPFPWIWSAHPLLNVQPGTTLEPPGVHQVKLAAVHGRDDLTRDDIVSWPGAIGGDPARFVFPERAGWAVKLFGDYGSGPVVLTDPRQGERLELAVSAADVPQVGLWLNLGGWAPAGRTPYYNVGVEPCIGAPDRLEDAVLRWQTAPVLEPGGERRWEIAVTLPEP